MNVWRVLGLARARAVSAQKVWPIVWLRLTLALTLADPGWASISRGVLVCDECCSVHRSLGRHISIVKHLRHSAWPPTLLQVQGSVRWFFLPHGQSMLNMRAFTPHPHTPPSGICSFQGAAGAEPNPDPFLPSTHFMQKSSSHPYSAAYQRGHVALSKSLHLSEPWHTHHAT